MRGTLHSWSSWGTEAQQLSPEGPLLNSEPGPGKVSLRARGDAIDNNDNESYHFLSLGCSRHYFICHIFIQQTFIEHLLNVRCCLGTGDMAVNKAKILALVELKS